MRIPCILSFAVIPVSIVCVVISVLVISREIKRDTCIHSYSHLSVILKFDKMKKVYFGIYPECALDQYTLFVWNVIRMDRRRRTPMEFNSHRAIAYSNGDQ